MRTTVSFGMTLLAIGMSCFWTGCSSAPSKPSGPPQRITQQIDPSVGLLAVFVQPGVSAHDRVFQAEWLPKIQAIAEEEGVPVELIDARRGAPAEVTATPALVYQNARGRSIYQGRYATVERVRTFLRTARYAPQGDALLTRTDLPVRALGRMTLALPIKIAPLSGTIPDDFDQSALSVAARNAIRAAFDTFRWEAGETELRRTDRLFYVDYYPWMAADGALYLSAKLFSQFHCKKPIWELTGEENYGLLIDAPKLYRNATAKAEQAILAALGETELGDGLDPLSSATTIAGWEALGLALPAPDTSDANAARAVDLELVREWEVLAAGEADPPQVRFRFMPPADLYTGVVQTVRGELRLGPDLGAGALAGSFRADLRTLTMGEPDLDDALQSPIFLGTELYPEAEFVIASTDAGDAPLRFGDSVGMVMTGVLRLKDQTAALVTRAQLEPFVSAEGEARLRLMASFELDIRPWDLEGPDVAGPAKHLMQFDVDIALAPVE